MRAAIEKGDAKGLAELILQNPGFKFQDVSIIEGIKTLYFPSESGTLLHYACRSSSRSAVIPLLLAHPGIDVNAKNSGGATPFDLACANGRTSCVREMLKDSRVKVNEPSNDGYTPLRRAARNGHLDVIKWWIASGREIDLGKPEELRTDAIGVAKRYDKTEVVTLLERFKSDAVKTRSEVRLEIGWYNEAAAEMFAMVVFVSDGLLKTKATGVKARAKRTRFFNIASQLPLELQMVLCYRVVQSAKEIIPGKDSEVAFKELARRL